MSREGSVEGDNGVEVRVVSRCLVVKRDSAMNLLYIWIIQGVLVYGELVLL